MKIGYCRVSTKDQNLDRQLNQLKEFGCAEIYQEKVSGTKMDRVQLKIMLDSLKEGDIVVIPDLTRLSRSTMDLFNLVKLIESKGANIKSLKESWIDTTTAHGKLLFTMFAGISQFERDLISQRTKEGLQAAREKGNIGGRPKLTRDNLPKKVIDNYELYSK